MNKHRVQNKTVSGKEVIVKRTLVDLVINLEIHLLKIIIYQIKAINTGNVCLTERIVLCNFTFRITYTSW